MAKLRRFSSLTMAGILVLGLFLTVGWETAQAQNSNGSVSEEKAQKTIPMPIDLPALAEIDPLDDENAAIRRFLFTSQGMRGQTVAIDGTEGWFCTLSLETHVHLAYWPTMNKWAFQVAFAEEAELTAGGLATCHRLPQ